MDGQVMQPAPAIPPQGQKANNKKLFIILGIVGAVFLIGAAIGGYFLYSTPTGPTEAARKLLLDIASGQVQLAYDETSSGFKSAGTVDDFNNFVNANPELQHTKSVSFSSVHIEGLDATAKGDVIDANGEPSPVTVTLVKVNGVWKVDSLSLTRGGGAPVPGKEETGATPPPPPQAQEGVAPSGAGPLPEPPKEGQGIFVQAFSGVQDGEHYDIYDTAGTKKIESFLRVNELADLATGTYTLYGYGSTDLVYASQVKVQAGKITVVKIGALLVSAPAEAREKNNYDIYDASGKTKLATFKAVNELLAFPAGTYVITRYGGNQFVYAKQVSVRPGEVTTLPLGGLTFKGASEYDIYDEAGTIKLNTFQPVNEAVVMPVGTYTLKKYGTDVELGKVTITAGKVIEFP